jgi:AMMECR1 domain-containing protein
MIVGNRHRGLLLPDVPIIYKWSCEEFVRYLCLKAGLPVDAWPRLAHLYAFSVEAFEEAIEMQGQREKRLLARLTTNVAIT